MLYLLLFIDLIVVTIQLSNWYLNIYFVPKHFNIFYSTGIYFKISFVFFWVSPYNDLYLEIPLGFDAETTYDKILTEISLSGCGCWFPGCVQFLKIHQDVNLQAVHISAIALFLNPLSNFVSLSSPAGYVRITCELIKM